MRPGIVKSIEMWARTPAHYDYSLHPHVMAEIRTALYLKFEHVSELGKTIYLALRSP